MFCDVQLLNITKHVPSSMLEMSRALFFAMGKLDIFRIDGRLNANDFTVIELTPDVGLSPSGIFSSAFSSAGRDYESMIEAVINISRGVGQI